MSWVESTSGGENIASPQVRFENNGGDGSSALVHFSPHLEILGSG